jgi:uncharacterized membrane protein
MPTSDPEGRLGKAGARGCSRRPDAGAEGGAAAGERAHFLDLARGVAVLCMLVLHSAHGWLRPDLLAQEPIGSLVRQLGGISAPTFLFVAGCTAALTVPGGRDWTRLALRGAQLVWIGYALRLALWVVDGAALATASGRVAVLLLAGGLAAMACTLRFAHLVGLRPAHAALLALPLLGGGLAAVLAFHSAQRTLLLRVDILHALGASCILLGLWLGPLGFGRRDPRWLWAVTLVWVAATPLASRHLPPWLPGPLAGYFSAVANAGSGAPISLFPLLPWAGFLWAGYAFGATSIRPGRPSGALCAAALGAAGLCLATSLSGETLAGLSPLSTSVFGPGLKQAARTACRLGQVLALLAGAAAAARLRLAWLARLGRASLLIYAVHLELTFGVFTQSFSRQLGLAAWAAGMAAMREARRRPGERAWTARVSRFAPIRPGRT